MVLSTFHEVIDEIRMLTAGVRIRILSNLYGLLYLDQDPRSDLVFFFKYDKI